MNVAFLKNFMRFVQTKTNAERSIVVDLDMTIHDRINMTEDDLQDASFMAILQEAINKAITEDVVVITNNLIDPNDAPETNIHLHKLKMMVAMPLPRYGAVYFDRPIRRGVFSSDLVESLNEFGHAVIENEQINLSPEEYAQLFQQ